MGVAMKCLQQAHCSDHAATMKNRLLFKYLDSRKGYTEGTGSEQVPLQPGSES